MANRKSGKFLARKRAGQAYHNLRMAVTILWQEEEIFRPAHPEQADEIKAIWQSVVVLMDLWERFAGEAWGDTAESLEDVRLK